MMRTALLTTVLASSLMASGALAQGPAENPATLAYHDLSQGNDDRAVERLEAAANDDPAVLINLGIAYARQGRSDDAKAMFVAALASDTPVKLETATGEWQDSRWLARSALGKLARGEFSGAGRLASAD
ncbi:hypothetical protein G7A66_01200 [Altererythrobacter sp. SALINAS58]|uniref:hypothetical protein n=1 Tax=Alteripontixanthobacter muriae TaxID=2705546 RepID=UPI001576951D|nr:hypothetical protein [Alteripontixanthobacter muriae]NTZ41724.1 hypothetical protein [Alteripontixanthobacter muriae]